MIIHNKSIAAMIRPEYSAEEIDRIVSFLTREKTLSFSPLPNGLFPAAGVGKDKKYTGYSYVWVRDNVYIANAHYEVGETAIAVKNVLSLMQFFSKHRQRFVDIIDGRSDPADPMNRPHVRFNGNTLEEIDEKWAHAQNDALGYFLWLFCKLVRAGHLTPSSDELNTLVLFPLYFQAIGFWQDEDSGHWEETRKISASSIGAVLAGLREYTKLIRDGKILPSGEPAALDTVKSLTARGLVALNSILPAECNQSDPNKNRPHDSALLFLLYPLGVVARPMSEKILHNVRRHLQGEFGIRRYLGDSYWAPDYKEKLSPNRRTMDFSDNLAGRDQLLPAIGEEAQWCIFDPIVSCIYGSRFEEEGAEELMQAQTEYLNRSLGQITADSGSDIPALKCPELYYMEHERYVPNDHIPLLWTQANLMLSLNMMKRSCILASGREAADSV